ncbi:ankyrin [Aspergillus violaceofuscus CBS 115571]|uniref:Ankyrin n=1 Tax=Aspergillus violaceofuscus (strain CBS 115571) TaxID=1450538 RepID=A0A2V5H5B9_ASPV1|nr:ankyrin [Aspergillus violaceofuscus CBS 115571]
MSERPRRRVLLHDYTVAWICALPIELAAAKCLLDHVHNSLPKPETDHNIYTLGSLSGHNIVVVCLPSGVYGTTSATSVVTQLKQTFPSVKFGLMVGVGGGVPTKNVNIRLGDVVVSTPTVTSGGVVQYDYGKTFQQGRFQRTGSLNKPHVSLLAALSQIRCDHMLQELPLGKIMSGVLRHHQKQFSPPGADWLFLSAYEHRGGNGDCSLCDKNQLVSHSLWSDASGNQVIKDAVMRDSIAEDIPVLCFEMEAAGLMDQLQCLVIRGICDYCDSHKHKGWQGHHLTESPSTDYLVEADFGEVEKTCLANLFITDPNEDMNSLKRKKGNRTPETCSWFLESDKSKSWFQRDKGNDQLERNILWLYGSPGIGKSTMAVTLVEEIPHTFFFCEADSERRREATSILRDALFASFDSLWALLMGIGQATTSPEIYCIIDASDECDRKSQQILSHQIYQLFGKTDMTCLDTPRLHFLIISRPNHELKSYLSSFTNVDLCSFEEVKKDLQSMIKDTVKDLARRNDYTDSVAQKVRQILEEKAEGTFLWVGIAHNELILVQSRKVVEKLQDLPGGLYKLYRKLLLDAATCGPDDYLLIKKILETVAFALRPLTIGEVAEACRLHLDTDSSSRLKFTREIIDLCHLLVVVDNDHFLMMEMQEINSSAANYTLTYRCIEVVLQHCRPKINTSTLKPGHGFLGYSVLHWPEHARLAQTDFNIPKEHEGFFQGRSATWKWWLESYNHLEQCSGADLDTGIYAIHVAARWGIIPLISDAQGQTPLLIAAQYSQFEAIKYLVESGACVKAENNDHQNWLPNYFLLDAGVPPYDFGNLDEELAQVFRQNSLDLTIKIRRLSWPGRTIVSMFTHRRFKDEKESAGVNLESGLTALHFSSLNACTKMTAFLLQHGADPNAQSDIGDTPLHLAIRSRILGREYDDVWKSGDYTIEALRDLITDYESEEASDIYRAIEQARTHIVDTLLASETIDVNIANADGDCPQHVIDFSKHYSLSILCKLIEKGAVGLGLNGCNQTCLHLASKQGNVEVVRKLVDEGHNILLEDSDGLSPFHYALRRSRLDVLHFLTTACDGALSRLWHSIGHHGRNPLHHHISSIFCNFNMVDFLIQIGCDVNQYDAKGNSSLGLNLAHLLMHYRGADIEILEHLFHYGPDPAAQNYNGRTSMHHGAIHGAFTKELVEFLQRSDFFDMHSRDSVGKTTLNYAEKKARGEDLEDVLFDPKWNDSFEALVHPGRWKVPKAEQFSSK